MKLNEPITDEDHIRADAEHRRIAENQIRFINEIADLIEAGKPLNSLQIGYAVVVLREGAKKLINPVRPRPAGGRVKIPDEARLCYADWIVHEGLSENAAMERIAEMYQVSMTAVKRKMGKFGSKEEKLLALNEVDEAFRMVGGRRK
ncbi:TPA: hypothetical protein ACKR13_000260 [Pseudomonas aeruginosa]|uniref:hypothetical protein n=1 Tax=Pseudomonas aeruginosa TaxID=287 RepID=UPI000F7497E3|nr:hypothetical protein [Pseudomonas aeruginosa]EIU5573146.1 hypothetical protein [Pseudomonas aeruginosa]MCU9051246.1 hypothetical protein [Pseudomonas aeruginosa]MCU9062536.1 hypothetical protein [Pseudomonas aeruginosa]MCU9112092.1 hypothetical protein [Pseudomonas aeruginosa]MCU9125210.1 hypothetical protein [Pseudomonas aeruginosa]